jgi:hypothetical protein
MRGMCFVSRVSRSSSRPNRARGVVARRARALWLRASWLRAFVLLLTLLGTVAQQRVLTPVVRPSASVARLVAERVQSIETHAVRAEPSLRVAPAPVFARLPSSFTEPFVAWPSFFVRAFSASPPTGPECASIGHFHGQRRIPRMNSEEPPRA